MVKRQANRPTNVELLAARRLCLNWSEPAPPSRAAGKAALRLCVSMLPEDRRNPEAFDVSGTPDWFLASCTWIAPCCTQELKYTHWKRAEEAARSREMCRHSRPTFLRREFIRYKRGKELSTPSQRNTGICELAPSEHSQNRAIYGQHTRTNT